MWERILEMKIVEIVMSFVVSGLVLHFCDLYALHKSVLHSSDPKFVLDMTQYLYFYPLLVVGKIKFARHMNQPLWRKMLLLEFVLLF